MMTPTLERHRPLSSIPRCCWATALSPGHGNWMKNVGKSKWRRENPPTSCHEWRGVGPRSLICTPGKRPSGCAPSPALPTGVGLSSSLTIMSSLLPIASESSPLAHTTSGSATTSWVSKPILDDTLFLVWSFEIFSSFFRSCWQERGWVWHWWCGLSWTVQSGWISYQWHCVDSYQVRLIYF